MSEFADVLIVSGTVNVPIAGTIYGVYAPSGSIDLDWVFNGGLAPIARGVKSWEPPIPFTPRETSYLSITSASPITVTIRRS